MKFWRITATIFCVLTLSSNCDAESKRNGLELLDGDRVVLLGGTFIERAQQFGELELALTAAYPDRQIIFRNLGWSGDTVWADSRGIFDAPAKGYDRMVKQLAELKPTLVMVAYGGNESFQGPEGRLRFVAQLNRLLDDLQKLNTDVILLTPHLHEPHPAPLPSVAERNQNLRLYAEAIHTVASARTLTVLDMQRLSEHLLAGKSASPLITTNSLHLAREGYRAVASVLAQEFHPSEKLSVSFDANGKVNDSSGITPKASDKFSFRPNTHSADEKTTLTVRVKDLKPGNYTVLVDDKSAGTFTHEELTKGVEVPLQAATEQREKLRQTIMQKNELYFHRWRPQNITYLYLFRKHEQGQNAKEVPQFEEYVKQKEAEIAKLKTPVWQTLSFQLVEE